MLDNSKISRIGTLYRHGDVLVKRIDRIPNEAQRREGSILAHGEVTGHSHRIQQAESVQLWGHGNRLFLEVKDAATLIHEEHRAIELSQGFYHVWKQREYRPDRYVEVED
jgi:hypothetical protein